MKLRPYQEQAVAAIEEEFKEHQSTLLVLPTGTGKTVTFIAAAMRRPGRCMIIAHRYELVWQAVHTIRAMTGQEPEIEMAERYANENGLHGQSKFVVASVQSLVSGNGTRRFQRFTPDEFSLLVADEAHHTPAATWAAVRNYFTAAPGCKLLGVTATPDRADERALGQAFESVAMNYELLDAINDGWLVPLNSHQALVGEMDLSGIETTAGDLNGAQLSAELTREAVLQKIVVPMVERVGNRRTLVFVVSVAQAERTCEIINRYTPGMAAWVCGKTPEEDRKKIFTGFKSGAFQFLVNVDVATEGYDDPGIEVIAIARPTKSRAKYAQMVGRGTRPIPKLVDGLETAEERREAISASRKPFIEIIDYVGNAGRHKLISPVDLLGGDYDDDVVVLAERKLRERGGNVVEALDAAVEEAKAKREARRQEEERRRAQLKVKVQATFVAVDAFDRFGIAPPRKHGWDEGRRLSEKQLEILRKQGVNINGIEYHHGKKLLDEIFRRWNAKEATLKQITLLNRYGINARDMSFDEASARISRLAENGWRNTSRVR